MSDQDDETALAYIAAALDAAFRIGEDEKLSNEIIRIMIFLSCIEEQSIEARQFRARP